MVNHKKIQRLWRDEGLRVPQRRRRKRVGSSTVDAPTADAPNVVWAVDFQFDADEHGRPSFNSRIRDERLNINSFYSLLHAQVIIGDWKDEYNHHRRHSSLGYLPPAEYARQCTHQMEIDDSQNVRTE